jgi:cytochrome c-type biogenesis protein CcmF
VPALVGYTFSAFALSAIILEFARGTRARHSTGGSWLGAFTGLVARNRRRYGGYVVHASIVLLLIGAAGVGAFSSSKLVQLSPGEAVSVKGYTLTYQGVEQGHTRNATEVRATLAVSRDGKEAGTISAGRNRYFAEDQTSNEIGLRTDWLRGEDLFVIADRFDPDGTVFVQVIVNPLVNLIWLAGLVFVLGSLITLWPDAREQRRIVERLEALAAFRGGTDPLAEGSVAPTTR